MKTSILYFILFIIFSASLISCNKDGLSFSERKILGLWEFEKVKRTENLSLRTDNLTDQYENTTIEFLEDRTAILYHNGKTYKGPWETTDNGENTHLSAALVESVTGEVYHLNFSSFSVMNNILRADKSSHQYWERYKLRKL